MRVSKNTSMVTDMFTNTAVKEISTKIDTKAATCGIIGNTH